MTVRHETCGQLSFGYNLNVMAIRELIFEVVEDPECGYRAKALGESIFTFGATLEELRLNVKEAVECHFDEGEVCPNLIRLHFVRDEVLSI